MGTTHIGGSAPACVAQILPCSRVQINPYARIRPLIAQFSPFGGTIYASGAQERTNADATANVQMEDQISKSCQMNITHWVDSVWKSMLYMSRPVTASPHGRHLWLRTCLVPPACRPSLVLEFSAPLGPERYPT